MDYGSQYADRRLKITEKRLQAVYLEARKDLEAQFDAFLKKHRAKGQEMMKKLADGEIDKQEYSDWMRRQVFIGKEWHGKIDLMTERLKHSNEEALAIVRGEQFNVFSENANYESYKIEKEMRGGVSFEIYDKDTVVRLVEKRPELLPRKTVNGKKDKAWNKGVISNAVTQAILQGESIDKLAARLSRDTANTDMKAMTRYARTAMTGAQNAGRIETMHRAQAMGIYVRKQWIATLDRRTRDSHRQLDGQVQDVDEPFKSEYGDIMFPGDPAAAPGDVYNCRCTLIHVYPKFADKGVMRMDNETGEIIEDMSYSEWEKYKQKRELTSSTKRGKIERAAQNNLKRVAQAKDELPSEADKIKAMIDYSSLGEENVNAAAEALFGYGSDPEHCYFSGADSEIRARKTDEASKRADAIQQYIDASPKAEGTIYRGMAIPKEVLDSLQVGTEFNEQQYAVSSWSSREDVGQRYASNSYNKYGGERVVFEYANPNHGTPVAHLSPMPIEQEVLVNNIDVRYRIVGREEYTKTSKANGDRKFTRIILEEMEGE